MKYAFWVTLAIFGTQSAQAGVTIPYKKISIDCSGLSQSLQLQWNFSKSPMMYRLLVNGKNEIGGTQMTYENGSSNYSKPNVFSIILNTEDDKAQFSKTVTISNETIPMICTQSSSWHVVESD